MGELSAGELSVSESSGHGLMVLMTLRRFVVIFILQMIVSNKKWVGGFLSGKNYEMIEIRVIRELKYDWIIISQTI